MISDLDLYDLAAPVPEGLNPGSDSAALTTGTLLGLDVDNGLAQIAVADSDGLWLPAIPAIYPPGGMVRLLRSPLDGGRLTVCLGPVKPGQMLVTGAVSAVNAAAGTLTVSALDGSYNLPYAPGTYVAGTRVLVVRSASKYGLPEFVLGPAGNFVSTEPGQPGGGGDNTGQLVSKQATILPTWSGSWRGSYSRWDSWNTSRYGGRSTLWQGSDFGSGPMTGLAVYGDRIKDLRAEVIDRITVKVWRADTSVSSGRVAVLQPSPHGVKPAGAPTIAAAATVSSPALTPGSSAGVVLPTSVLEGFRTGAYKGLATVGSQYGGFSGTPDKAPIHADGMALTIQYKVRV